MKKENNTKYKITLRDIIIGIISLAIFYVVAMLGFQLFIGVTLSLSDFFQKNFHPLIGVIALALGIMAYGLFVGFAKAIECGFSPWGLLDRFKKKNNKSV